LSAAGDGRGCTGAGEVGEEEDKAHVVMGQKEPVKSFFAFNSRTNLLDFFRMRYYILFNSVLTKIHKMKASFFRIFISKFLKFFKNQIQLVDFRCTDKTRPDRFCRFSQNTDEFSSVIESMVASRIFNAFFILASSIPLTSI
jgi:hypothetical protein